MNVEEAGMPESSPEHHRQLQRFEHYVRQSRDPEIQPGERYDAQRGMIGYAKNQLSLEIWDRVAVTILAAFEEGYLNDTGADRFQKYCPIEVFRTVAFSGPGRRFGTWRKRADKLSEEGGHRDAA